MPLYRLGNPNITAISHAGVEHRVNADGLLEVEDRFHTAELQRHVTQYLQGEAVNPEQDPANTPEEAERQALFVQLDGIYGRRIDRRRSLQQLRDMLEEHHRRQQRTAGAAAAAPSQGIALSPPPPGAQD